MLSNKTIVTDKANEHCIDFSRTFMRCTRIAGVTHLVTDIIQRHEIKNKYIPDVPDGFYLKIQPLTLPDNVTFYKYYGDDVCRPYFPHSGSEYPENVVKWPDLITANVKPYFKLLVKFESSDYEGFVLETLEEDKFNLSIELKRATLNKEIENYLSFLENQKYECFFDLEPTLKYS